MIILVVLLNLSNGIDISGYAETRPYLALGDSVNFFGYSRGWLEFKLTSDYYGAQTAFDYIIPYDTLFYNYGPSGLTVSRLAIWLGPDKIRITAGKQKIAWGVARAFKPLDLFNPVNFFELGYERAGVNALYGYLALGSLSSLRCVTLPQRDLKKSLSGCRFGTNLLRNDVGLNIFYRPEKKMAVLGGDIAGELAIGYWGEFTYTDDDSAEFVKTSAGIDYTFPLMIYAMAEYFYDQSGVADPADYDYTQLLTGKRTTLGQHYLYLSLGLTQNMFLRPAINSVINIGDRGYIIIPNIIYGLFDNVDINVGANIFAGPPDSEFRHLSGFDALFYIWAKAYF